jgi:hypothetical protein
VEVSTGLQFPIRNGAQPLGLRVTNIVMSVPHSGTRSLVETGIDGQKYGLEKWWHFHVHEDRLERRMRHGHGLHLHIPVRDPLDVASAWLIRKKKLPGLLRCYASMFRCLERDDIAMTLHTTSALPFHIGATDKERGRPPIAAYTRKWHDAIREAVLEPHQAFFEEHLA